MLKFGIPSKRKRKEERHPNTPVITMVEQPDNNGAYKFSLNKMAISQLGYDLTGDEQISFAFEGSDMYVANTTGTEHTGYRVAKQGSFSNTKLYGYVKDLKGLDTSSYNEFVLHPCPHDGFYELRSFATGDVAGEVVLEKWNEEDDCTYKADTSEIDAQAQIEVEELTEQKTEW